MTIERRMDTVERRRFWRDVDVLATQAKRLPSWMRGKDDQSKPQVNSASYGEVSGVEDPDVEESE